MFAGMPGTDYSNLSREELIARLGALKGEIATRPSGSALRDSEERLRAILETAVEGIITIDERGTVESINPAAAQMFGYTPAEVIGRNVKMLMPSPYQDEHDTYLQNYRETGYAKIIGIGREVIGQRKDGKVFPMELSVAEIQLAEGRRFVGFVRDITARKQSEQQTLAALKELTDVRAALDEHSIVAVTDAQGRITHVNDKFVAISKYSREELIGYDHRIINSGHHSKEFFKELWTTIAHGKVWRGEIRNRAKDGTYYWVDTTIFPFLDPVGKPTQYVAIRTDITERKANEEKLKLLTEELAEKNKELETVVYIVSHDLRSPLVNVQGFSKQLARACEKISNAVSGAKDGLVPADQLKLVAETTIPQALKFITTGVSKMDSLLAGFLRFSRLGRVVLKIAPLDMNAMVNEIITTMRFQLDQARAQVQVDPLPPCLGDNTHTGQVFSNLIDNALKYRDPSRTPVIRITGRLENGRAIYSVTDNGVGIAPEHQAKVFDIFHRLNPTAAPGEGLGLTIVQRILERQGGKIWIESHQGAGATFHISLPALH